MSGTPTMRVCAVDEFEDFTVKVVTDVEDSTLDVAVVTCGPLADARVRVVTDTEDADEFVLVVSGSF